MGAVVTFYKKSMKERTEKLNFIKIKNSPEKVNVKRIRHTTDGGKYLQKIDLIKDCHQIDKTST